MPHRSGPPLVNLWEKADLQQAFTLALLPHVSNELKKPLLVTEIGAYLANGGDDEAHELAWFKNALSLLNQWGIGYVAWGWASDAQIHHGMVHEGKPNEAGKVMLDSLSK